MCVLQFGSIAVCIHRVKIYFAVKRSRLSLSQNIKKYFLPALLVVAVIISLLRPSTDSLHTIANKIQTQLNNDETNFFNAIADKTLEAAFESSNEEAKVIEDLESKNILLFYYSNDSLIHWTNNTVLPSYSPSSTEDGSSFTRLKNGWYASFKWSDSVSHKTILALVPVKYEYPFENKFLQKEFALGLQVPHNIELTDQKIDGSVPVKNLSGETLFSLYVSGEEKGEDINYYLLFAQLILLLIVFYYVHLFAIKFVAQNNFFTGFSFLFISILLLRSATILFNYPGELNKLEIFDPKYYASSIATKSLGDLIINSLLLSWITFFFTYFYKWKEETKASSVYALAGIIFVFVYTACTGWVFKTLVMDSVISFEVYNVLSLNLYSLLGLVCIALLLIAHFIITRTVVQFVVASKFSGFKIFLFVLICGIASSTFAIGSTYYESILFTCAWLVLFIIILSFLLQKQNPLSIRNIILYVSLYSFLSAYLIENLYERKERNQRIFFSGKLVTERDYVAEYMFEDIAHRILHDAFIKNFFSNPVIAKKDVYERINSLYLGGYFNKYDVKISAFDVNGNSFQSDDTTHLSAYKNILSDSSSLQYVSDTVRNYSYFSFINFQNDSGKTGSFIIRLLPKIYYGQNVYPELLLGSSVTVSNNINNYAYAIYQSDKLVAQYGDYPYPYYWNKNYSFAENDLVFIEEPKWEHNIQQFKNGKKVIVSIPREPLFEPVATFSYLFTFYFVAVLLLLFVSKLIMRKLDEGILTGSLQLSFRTRINYSMLAMIILSFIIIGIITISFFSRQYDNFYTDRLLRKEKVVHATLEYFIQQNMNEKDFLSGNLNNSLEYEISRIAEINSVDINLFFRSGDLAVSSQPFIYAKGLVSKKMNPDAYFDLEKNKSAQVTEQEKIGCLKYLATYAPIRNSRGEAMAYIGIPYFERSKNINDEVSSFLVALMNVYVFLLICAAVLAYFISNSITRPLTIISEKLRILNLNKKNEPIEWNSKDEIGVLVNEYNKMITELEQSAQKLAKGERESAWREMAKQIAHEIKNPLTPMKLSIQYLQRAISEGQPNIEELAKKVAKTLEEQIENLSSIATAFSSFAKMPKAENEIIPLNQLLKSIVDLFNREEGITIQLISEVQNPMVFADKNQLVSVFNNLVKNAIQSIPENRKGFIDIKVEEQNGWVITTVKDNGSGIPKEFQESVFVPNFTTKSSGTGLGLAITKQIIDGAGGKIWFSSEENTGTVFYVQLKLNAK